MAELQNASAATMKAFQKLCFPLVNQVIRVCEKPEEKDSRLLYDGIRVCAEPMKLIIGVRLRGEEQIQWRMQQCLLVASRIDRVITELFE